MTDKSVDELIKENEKLVYFVIQKHYPTRASDDDVIQCGMIGLWKAIKLYDPSKNTKFSTLACKCISNEIISFLKKDTRQTRLSAMSLTDAVENVNSELPIYDTHQEEQLSWIDATTYLDQLTDEDKHLLKLYIEGYGLTEIGSILGITKQAVFLRNIRIRNTIEKSRQNDH